MRLYSGKVGPIATEVTKALISGKQIETESPHEVELDVSSVLNNYVRLEQEASTEARDHQQRQSLPSSEIGRIKRQMAERRGIKTGEETLDFLLDQVVEMLMHSANVEEVYGQDHELRRTMTPIFKRHMSADDELDREVRGQLKHVREGTSTWEVEYQRMREEIKRRKGL